MARDLAGWQGAVALFQEAAPNFLPLHFSALPSAAMFRHLGRVATGGLANAFALSRLSLETPRQFVDRRFSSPEVKGVFTPWAFHLDYGPDVRGGAMFLFVSAMSAYRRGMNVIEGGAGRLASALAMLVKSYGGEVLTGTTVTGIEIRSGRAAGVRTQRGDVISARRAVVANVTPKRLFGGLVPNDHLPAGFRRRIGRFRYAAGTFVVYLALAQELEWRGAPDLARFSYVHLCGTTEELGRNYAEAMAGLIPARPMLIVNQTSHVDPSRAPPGKNAVRIHARAFPANIRGDAAGQIEARDWDSAKEAVADRLIDLLAEHAPNARSALLGRHAMSPLDLERSNPNLVDGDCNGGSHHLDQYYFARPALGWSRYATPIQALHMIGASQWPGSGIHGASGYLLAQQLLA